MFRKKIIISPLLLRLLTLNILALFFLLGGLFSIDRYQQTLEENEFQKLEDEGRILAQAIGRSILHVDNFRSQIIITNEAQVTISHLIDKSRVRIRLFSYQGDLLADSKKAIGFQSKVKETLLSDVKEKNIFRIFFEKIYSYISFLVAKTSDIQFYQENVLQQAEDYEEVLKALYGDEIRKLRQLEDGTKIFSVALPVQSYRKISGAILLTLDSLNIEEKIQDFRYEVFKIFFLALFLTVCVSIYLSANIVKPIRKLATIAKNINPSEGRNVAIPQFPGRKDEINDLAVSLKEMLNSLWNRMDAIENFAADVSHEIKNPLTSLKSAVEVASKTKNKKKLETLSKIIIQDVQRLDRLVTDISNASRIDAELSREGMKKISLKKIIKEITDFYNRNLQRVVLNFENKSIYNVLGNQERISQVFINLIDNALSFNKKNERINITLKNLKDFVIIYIDDFGPGIPKENEEKIFNRFYSERPRSEAFGQHSGLGLSIAKQIIEIHGGSIKAENRLNKFNKIEGARFIISFKQIQKKAI